MSSPEVRQEARNRIVSAIDELRKAASAVENEFIVRISKNSVTVAGLDGETHVFSFGEDDSANTMSAVKAARAMTENFDH